MRRVRVNLSQPREDQRCRLWSPDKLVSRFTAKRVRVHVHHDELTDLLVLWRLRVLHPRLVTDSRVVREVLLSLSICSVCAFIFSTHSGMRHCSIGLLLTFRSR